VAKLSTPEQRQAYLAGTVENSVFVERTYQVKRVLEDPDDNKFLGLAMTVGAPNIISGDAHLEGIKHYQGIQIWSPESFLQLERERDRLAGEAVTPRRTRRRPGHNLDDR